jgi:hypothetical protein
MQSKTISMTDLQQNRIAKLRSEDPRERVAALRALLVAPDPTSEVAAAVDQLLEDRTIAILSIPYRFGEIRYLAAEVAASIRAAAKQFDNPVVLEPGYRTMSLTQMGPLLDQTGCDTSKLDPSAQYAWLRDHGKLEANVSSSTR